jgi:hypothetical protein
MVLVEEEGIGNVLGKNLWRRILKESFREFHFLRKCRAIFSAHLGTLSCVLVEGSEAPFAPGAVEEVVRRDI